jgi:N-acetylglucosaminyldiphosphoundecaprenol N-acetyl-beta-D-mannosaminyltransferase
MSKQKVFKTYDLLGIKIDAVNMAEAIDYITEIAHNPDTSSCYVAKPYVEFLDRAHGNKELIALLNASELCLADGVALQWAVAFLHGGPRNKKRFWALAASIIFWPGNLHRQLPERFGGTSFTWPLLRACRDQELRVYLIGSPQGITVHQTARVIRAELPRIQVVGVSEGAIAGKRGDDLIAYLRKNPPTADFIKPILEAKPDVILVGMGFPLQEYVMARLMDELPHGVLVGEGGTFDYESFGGVRRKAPRWMQKIGLEWLWRLILEPSRWRRMLAIPRFMRTIYQMSFPKESDR